MSISETLSRHNARLQKIASTFNITLPGGGAAKEEEQEQDTHSSERYLAILQKYSAPIKQSDATIKPASKPVTPEPIEEQSLENIQELLKKYHYNPENQLTIKRSSVQSQSPPEEPIKLQETKNIEYLSPLDKRAEERASPSPCLDQEDERVSFTLSQSSVGGGFRASIGHEEIIQTSRGEQETKILLTPIKESHREEEVKVEPPLPPKEPVVIKTPKKLNSQPKQAPPPKYDQMWGALEEQQSEFKLDYATLQQTLQSAAQILAPKQEPRSSPPLSPIPDASFSLNLSEDRDEEEQVFLKSTGPKDRKAVQEPITPPSKLEKQREPKIIQSKREENKAVQIKKEEQKKQQEQPIRGPPKQENQERGGKKRDLSIEKVQKVKEVKIRMSARRLASGRAEVRVWAQ